MLHAPIPAPTGLPVTEQPSLARTALLIREDGVVSSEVSIDSHGQCAAVLVPQPLRDGRNVHVRLNANSGEEVSKVMMPEMRDSGNLCSTLHRVCRLSNPENSRITCLVGALRTHRQHHCLQLWGHRNAPHLAVFRAGLRATVRNQMTAMKVDVIRHQVLGLTDPQAGLSEEADERGAVPRLSSTGGFDGGDELVELVKLSPARELRRSFSLASGQVFRSPSSTWP